MTVLVECKHQSHYTLIQMDDGKANALSFEMLAQLGAALDQAEQAGKVVIICGRPGKWSAGFDLCVMGGGGDAMIDLLRTGANMALEGWAARRKADVLEKVLDRKIKIAASLAPASKPKKRATRRTAPRRS